MPQNVSYVKVIEVLCDTLEIFLHEKVYKKWTEKWEENFRTSFGAIYERYNIILSDVIREVE